MKIIGYSFLAALLFAGQIEHAISQTVEVKPSKVHEVTAREEIRKLVGSDRNALYVVATQSSGLNKFDTFLKKVDKNTMAEIWNKKLEGGTNLVMVKDKMLQLDVVFTKFQHIDLQIATINANGERSAPVSKAKADLGKMGISPKLSWEAVNTFSPDSSKILLVLRGAGMEQKQVAKAVLLNTSDFSTIWEKDIQAGHEKGWHYLYNFKVDNNGDVYYLFTYIMGKEKMYRGSFAKIAASETTPKVMELLASGTRMLNFTTADNNSTPMYTLEDGTGVKFLFSGNNQIRINGFFKEGETTAGVFQAMVNKADLTIAGKMEEAFPADVNTRLASLGYKGFRKQSFRLGNIVEAGNGVYLFGQLIKDASTNENRDISFQMLDDVFVYIADNKIAWVKTIPQEETTVSFTEARRGHGMQVFHTRESAHFSFPVFQKGNSVYLIRPNFTTGAKKKDLEGTEYAKFPAAADKELKGRPILMEYTPAGLKNIYTFANLDPAVRMPLQVYNRKNFHWYARENDAVYFSMLHFEPGSGLQKYYLMGKFMLN